MEKTTPNKYAGLGAAIAAKLMIDFWFGIGVILAVGVVDNLNYSFEALYEQQMRLPPLKWQNKLSYNK